MICFFKRLANGFYFDLEKSYSFLMTPSIWRIPFRLCTSCFSRANNSNGVRFDTVAITHRQQPQRSAQSKKQKSLFCLPRILNYSGLSHRGLLSDNGKNSSQLFKLLCNYSAIKGLFRLARKGRCFKAFSKSPRPPFSKGELLSPPLKN